MRKLYALALALLSTVAVAQQKVNPATQISWPAITGTVSPSGACTPLNYGMPYVDVTSGVSYTCTTLGWVPSPIGTVLSGEAGQFGYYAATGTTITGHTLTSTDIAGVGVLSNATSGNAATATNATEVGGVTISGTPETGYVPIATGPTTATWQANTVSNPPFSAIASGDNSTADMVVNSGATLTYAGQGVINASSLDGITAASFATLTGTNIWSGVNLVNTGGSWSYEGAGTINASSLGGLAAGSYCQSDGTNCASSLTTTPAPTYSALGGVYEFATVANEFLTGISATGLPTAAQPAFTNISGALGCGQFPSLTGGVTNSGCATTLTPSAVVSSLSGQTVSVGALSISSLTIPTATLSDCLVVGTGGAIVFQPCDSAGNYASLTAANIWTMEQTISTGGVGNALLLTSTNTNTTDLQIDNTSGNWEVGVIGSTGGGYFPIGSFAFTDLTGGTYPFYLTSTGAVATSLTDSALTTTGDCVTVGTGGLLTESTCATSNVSLSTANTWTAAQTISYAAANNSAELILTASDTYGSFVEYENSTISGTWTVGMSGSISSYGGAPAGSFVIDSLGGSSDSAYFTSTGAVFPLGITDSALTTAGDCVVVGTGGLLGQSACGGGATLGANTFTSTQTIQLTTQTAGVVVNGASTAIAGYEANDSTAARFWIFGDVGSAGVDGAPASSFAFTDATDGVVPMYLTNTGADFPFAVNVTGTATLHATTATSLTDSGLTVVGDCVTVGTGGLLSEAACGSGSSTAYGQTVTSVSVTEPAGASACAVSTVSTGSTFAWNTYPTEGAAAWLGTDSSWNGYYYTTMLWATTTLGSFEVEVCNASTNYPTTATTIFLQLIQQ